jgi:hypothetical protein
MLAAALIGLGLLILFLNVGEAATLVRSLRIVGHEADSLGILTATAMAVRQTLQAYLFNHTEFLRALYEVLLSFSGMLLIVTGTVFSAVIFAAGGESQKKGRGHVDFAASHSTHRWKQDSAENEQQEVLLLNLNNLGGKTMRVMVIIKADKTSEAGIQPTKQTREMFAAMGKFNEELVKAGVVLAMDGLQPSSKGKRVRFSGQERTVTDGPFTETKELVGGFWLWQVKSMEEAVEWLKRAPFDGGTEVEIRPVYEVVDFPADVITPEHAARMRAVRDELQKKAAKP